MRNTIRNVMMVVPVLITSCQVSEYLKNGPVTAHASTVRVAVIKAAVEPENWVILSAIRPKNELDLWEDKEFIAQR